MTDRIILVHGTWGRGYLPWRRYAEWTRGDQPLGSQLDDAGYPSSAVARHNWSGRNSHRSRKRAARKLAEHLRRERTDNPSVRYHVVAHSHGGTVALRSARLLQDDDSQWDSITCFATPVINRLHRNPKGFECLTILLALLSLATLPLWVPLLDAQLHHANMALQPLTSTAALLQNLSANTKFVWGLTALGVFMVVGFWIRHQLRKDPFAIPAAILDRTLFVRRSGDEASLLISATTFLDWLGDRLIRLTRYLLIPSSGLALLVVVTLFLVLVVAPGAALVQAYRGDMTSIITLLVAGTALLFPALLLIIATVRVLGGSLFGWDLALANIVFRYTADDTPGGCARLHRLDVGKPEQSIIQVLTSPPALGRALLADLKPGQPHHSAICFDPVAARLAIDHIGEHSKAIGHVAAVEDEVLTKGEGETGEVHPVGED